jgi:putative tryptophan/tyrosine transport system substrate-binding protein
MKRREFIAGLGGTAAVWPLAARAQQRPTPVLGFLSSRSSESDASMLVALRQGLNETGFVEGQNLLIEYRFADAEYGRLPALVSELVLGHVAVIVFAGARGTIDDAFWRQLRTSNIPVVFNTGIDPVMAGLVRSLNRPGGNFTGIYSLVGELAQKNLGLLRELVPNAKTIAMIADAAGLDAVAVKDVEKAAAALGMRVIIISAKTESELGTAFASLDQRRPDVLVVPTNPIFLTRAKQIAALAARHGVPAIYGRRDYAVAGGLMSYGYDVADGYRQMGNYAGRILKGEKAGDLPVFRPTKFELVINLRTAKALGLTIPETLLATADEVIQ